MLGFNGTAFYPWLSQPLFQQICVDECLLTSLNSTGRKAQLHLVIGSQKDKQKNKMRKIKTIAIPSMCAVLVGCGSSDSTISVLTGIF